MLLLTGRIVFECVRSRQTIDVEAELGMLGLMTGLQHRLLSMYTFPSYDRLRWFSVCVFVA